MNVKVQRDRRCAEDKRYDVMLSKMVRDAALTAKQRLIVSQYVDTILREKINEVENAMNCAFWIALIESERFGRNKRATRLPRLQKYVIEVLNEAYSHDCFDANLRFGYDGLGLVRLRRRLKDYGIEVEE